MTILIETFLPDMYQKYLFQNYAMTTVYRPYNDNIPDFLRDRPRKVVLHCMDRMRKSSKFKNEDIQTEHSDGRFKVASASGKVHKVDFGKETGIPSCTCLDWMRFHIPCKHFFAIFSNETDWSWYSLPPTYLASPLLRSDQEALLGAFPNPNDTVDEGPFDLLAEPQEEVSQQSCKQPQDGLPEKQVTNSSLKTYPFICIYLSTFSVLSTYCRAIHTVFIPFKGRFLWN